jgi:hypothetical protein
MHMHWKMKESDEMSEAIANAAETPVPPAAWDPFQLMDRLDEEALRKELEGVASTDLVYVVREGGHEVVGLSKTGVDECCMALVSQGQVIREEDLQYELIGEGEDRDALFKVKAARFAVSPAGQEVRLDQVIGVKRQPLYYGPNRLNPHWYEHGAMKAARNARFRLLPGNIRAQVIAAARQSGQTRVVEAQPGTLRGVSKAVPVPAAAAGTREAGAREAGAREAGGERVPAAERTSERGEAPSRIGPYAPTEKQVAFYQRLAESPVFSEEERRRALEWLATKATRQTIKDQIDWLKRQVETRRANRAGESAA